ncbi:MAG: FtsW/RodA/SpoVE family cell cycle protein, partial [Mailhella sp.]|nr:FtsW/RodA/SpoVE family cell cycle protein [Mailhella sp.]
LGAAAALALLIMVEPYRLHRWTAFLDPFAADAKTTAWQLRQSLYALGMGGFFGTGIGGSLQKIKYLSQSHNDFILSIIGEEVGFVGVAVLMFLFAAFIWRCFRVAIHQHDLHDRLNAFGFTVAMCISILFNIAVVFGAVPPKGVALPFISYGGSSLIANMICAGFLLHYSRTSRE